MIARFVIHKLTLISAFQLRELHMAFIHKEIEELANGTASARDLKPPQSGLNWCELFNFFYIKHFQNNMGKI